MIQVTKKVLAESLGSLERVVQARSSNPILTYLKLETTMSGLRLSGTNLELDLETNVDVGSVDGWRPPESETSVGDLVQTGTLSVGELLEFHALFKTRSFFPEQAFPGRERCGLEQRVLQDGLNTTESLDNVGTVGVEIPKFSIVTLTSPPEWVGLHVLVDLELRSGSESLVEGKRGAILLEKSVDSGQTSVPRVF